LEFLNLTHYECKALRHPKRRMSEPESITHPFPITRWSLVTSSREQHHGAIAELCQLYWQPLYVYARRTGLSVQDAEDVTQRFFTEMIQNEMAIIREVSPEGGRLRTLFLRVLQRRIVDHHRHQTREKRGGGKVYSLETVGVEASLQLEGSALSAESSFDRAWALQLLRLALQRLERDFAASNRTTHFEVLRPFLGLSDEAALTYAELQQTLRLNEAAARQTVHRFRERFRLHLREEIATTLETVTEAAIDDELRNLRAILLA
jgi:RNA polymerase sigma factor (sigma-70 family)